MSNLISTAGGRVVALKNNIVITDEMREQFKNREIKDIDKELIDISNTIVLLEEIPISPIIYNDGNYYNELSSVKPVFDTPTHIASFTEYKFGDEQIPELMKSAGLKIKRKNHALFIEWSDEEKDLIFKDENGNISNIKKEADIDALGNMTIHDTIYFFKKEDF